MDVVWVPTYAPSKPSPSLRRRLWIFAVQLPHVVRLFVSIVFCYDCADRGDGWSTGDRRRKWRAVSVLLMWGAGATRWSVFQKYTDACIFFVRRICIHTTRDWNKCPFAEKQVEILFQLICCERKILFRLKTKLKKTNYTGRKRLATSEAIWWDPSDP